MAEWWYSYKMTFGKHVGDTMYVIYLNDYSYIEYLDGIDLDKNTRKAVDAAIEHKNRT